MKAARRVRAALLRLAPPWRRRHPVQRYFGEVVSQTFVDAVVWDIRNDVVWRSSSVDANAAAERDPTDEAGA